MFWRTQTDARTATEKSFKCCLSVADVNPHYALDTWQTWEMIVQPEYLLKCFVTRSMSMQNLHCIRYWHTSLSSNTMFRREDPYSNDIRKLLVPRTHNKLGDRSFSAAGPRLWNDLPPGLRRPRLSFDSFRRSLKTHLFGN